MDRIPNKLPFTKKRLRPRVVLSYIADYVILIACIAGFYVLDSIEPYHQHFSLRNISIQYPYAVHERVTIQEALCISGVAPLLIIAVYTLFIDGLFSHNKPQDPVSGKRKFNGPYRWKDRLWELNCGVLGLLLSQGLTFVITQVLKNACGKPRPDFIDRCQPRAGSQDAIPGLSNSTICTGEHALIKDGFRSWPSGHSSSSFAGLFYLTLWMSGKLHIMDNKGEVWKALLVMIPSLGATLVAVSRIMDARHHPFDVITGSLLGIICAIISYHQYFPPLSQPWKKGRAHPIRSWGTDPLPPSDTMETMRFEGSTTALRHPEDGSQFKAMADENNGATYHPASNPYVTDMYTRRSQDGDGTWSSSSEDVHANGYEMQRGYTRARNPGLGGSDSHYESTAYNPPQLPQATTSLHAPTRVMTAQLDRGRDLTEMHPREV
ncbi:phosphatase PAP2 family protein [Aspergillus saccharolyticus JOP 1030-1]|uniref:Phosphatidic acid phosphatase n=1 Tax=Aspergillus saccharolyticus JOP 1030-1 TaxID=1450539 RepID=A0A318YZS4_9EURO|nr:phosphatidic acid phosphatase [Aspergillus saccharolyticus JOP 1030-1]PYH40511.1 phosphatidic acid phosphatase [Aspergillus saccharolyticus JOP 1030-1]